MKILFPGILIVSLTIFSHAQAIELSDATQIHGFFNQAYLYSPDNPYAGTDAGNGSLKFREIGLNGFHEVSPEFRVAGQVLSRQQDQADDGDVRVDFLLADYLFLSNQVTSFGARVGRVKNNIGFYNAVRDIPSARPGFNVPDSIYFPSFRDTLLSLDGINLYGATMLGEHIFTWELAAGQRGIDSEDFEYFFFGRPLEKGKVDDVPIRLLNLNLVPAFQRNLRIGASLVNLEIELKDTLSASEAQSALMNAPPGDVFANPQRYITGGEVDGLLAILSAQYSLENWIVTAEYLNLDSDSKVQIAGVDSASSNRSEAYYLQLEWLATTQTSWFTRYEELYLDTDDRSGRNSLLDYNPHRGFGRGWTVGGKWLFADNWALLGQSSFNEGTAWLPTYKGIENNQIGKYWNYYVLSLNYQF